ncbi:MAG: LUD domain-containing protein [Flavobacteriia bacterium]|nr:LUD domain-containing protein [Flavobacteriia bacterium]
MAQKGKPGLFGKFLSVLSGKPDDSREEETPEAKSPYAPKEEEPIDLRFVQTFTQNGGHFLYCESFDEAIVNVQKICMESQLQRLYVPEENVNTPLKKNGLAIELEKASICDGVVTTCEALVAFNGGIMITDHQLGIYKISELPETHVILARTGQIVDSLSSGMSRINNTYRNNRPNQITTLKGAQSESVRQASADPNKNRTLYLLLIEDDLR